MRYPKHDYIRSKKHLRAVASLDCQHCGSGNSVQAAHTNWGGGKGRGVKADDNLTAALCQDCHSQLDQGKDLSRDDRKQLWVNAHLKTVDKLQSLGLWDASIPVPNVSELL